MRPLFPLCITVFVIALAVSPAAQDIRADSVVLSFSPSQLAQREWSGYGMDVVECDFVAYAPAPNKPGEVAPQVLPLLAGHPLLLQSQGVALSAEHHSRLRGESAPYLRGDGTPCSRPPLLIVYADFDPLDLRRWKRLIMTAAEQVGVSVSSIGEGRPWPRRRGLSGRSRVEIGVGSAEEAARLRREIHTMVRRDDLPSGAVEVRVVRFRV